MPAAAFRRRVVRPSAIHAFGRSIAVAASGATLLLALFLAFERAGDPSGFDRGIDAGVTGQNASAQWASLGPQRDGARATRRR